MTIAVDAVRPQSDTPVLPADLLGTAAVDVAGALCRLTPASGGSVAVTTRELAELTGVAERTVQRALRALERAGVLMVDASPGAANRFTMQTSA